MNFGVCIGVSHCSSPMNLNQLEMWQELLLCFTTHKQCEVAFNESIDKNMKSEGGPQGSIIEEHDHSTLEIKSSN